MGERHLTAILVCLLAGQGVTPTDSRRTGINRTYRSLKAAKLHPSSTNRSSEDQQRIPAALPVFLLPGLMKIHPTESAEVLLLAVVVDYSSPNSVLQLVLSIGARTKFGRLSWREIWSQL